MSKTYIYSVKLKEDIVVTITKSEKQILYKDSETLYCYRENGIVYCYTLPDSMNAIINIKMTPELARRILKYHLQGRWSAKPFYNHPKVLGCKPFAVLDKEYYR